MKILIAYIRQNLYKFLRRCTLYFHYDIQFVQDENYLFFIFPLKIKLI